MRHDDRGLPADHAALRDNHRSLRKVDDGLILDQPEPGQGGARQRIAEVEHRRLNAGCAVNAVVDRLGAKLLRERSRSEENTSELQSLMRNSYAVYCLKKKTNVRKKNKKARI